jgi:hypothetical protein
MSVPFFFDGLGIHDLLYVLHLARHGIIYFFYYTPRSGSIAISKSARKPPAASFHGVAGDERLWDIVPSENNVSPENGYKATSAKIILFLRVQARP